MNDAALIHTHTDMQQKAVWAKCTLHIPRKVFFFAFTGVIWLASNFVRSAAELVYLTHIFISPKRVAQSEVVAAAAAKPDKQLGTACNHTYILTFVGVYQKQL